MTHPRLYSSLADDFSPAPDDFRPLAGASIFHLLIYDGPELCGLYITHPINAALWEIHHAILPSAWGRTDAIGAAFDSWFWEHMVCAETVIGFTPANNALALRYARRHGFTECGRIPRAVSKQRQLVDLVVFSKSRTVPV